MNKYVTLVYCLIVSTLSYVMAGEVITEERFRYYMIAPESVSEIKTELRQHSPVTKFNRMFHGNTQWQVEPHFRWRQSPFDCRITDVEVVLNTTYTMPKMSNETSATQPTLEEFNRYYDALLTHERGHHEIGLEAAKEIDMRLRSLPPAPTCSELTTNARTEIQALIDLYKEKNSAYDQVTDHGRTQGAVVR